MESGPRQQFWGGFARDPRVPDNAALRASDADRNQVTDAIAEAYADGRLDTAELDDRISRVNRARTLGELVPLVSDLMPVQDPTQRQLLAYASEAEIERRAQARYAERRRLAMVSLLPALICLVIYIGSVINVGGFVFPWPIFVFMASGGFFSMLLRGKTAILEEEREKVREKQRKALEKERLGLPAPTDEQDDDGDETKR